MQGYKCKSTSTKYTSASLQVKGIQVQDSKCKDKSGRLKVQGYRCRYASETLQMQGIQVKHSKCKDKSARIQVQRIQV